MKWSEVATRVNGISTPFFGVSWEPATSDVEVVRGLIHYVEGRRMLYERHKGADWPLRSGIERMERSVSGIRMFVTDILVKGGVGAELAESLKVLQRATMDCLDGLERWLDFFEVWSGKQFDVERVTAQEAAVEDLQASVALFRCTVDKVMHDVAKAHKLEFETLR